MVDLFRSGRLPTCLGAGAVGLGHPDLDGPDRPRGRRAGRAAHRRAGRSLYPSVAGPSGPVESRPELHTELSRPRAGVHGIAWQQGRCPKSAASAPNATHSRGTPTHECAAAPSVEHSPATAGVDKGSASGPATRLDLDPNLRPGGGERNGTVIGARREHCSSVAAGGHPGWTTSPRGWRRWFDQEVRLGVPSDSGRYG